jgi:hypothetical protein
VGKIAKIKVYIKDNIILILYYPTFFLAKIVRVTQVTQVTR